MSEHGACFVFFLHFKRSIWVKSGQFGGLILSFLTEKNNNIFVLIRLLSWFVVIVTITDRRIISCLGLWKLGQFLKITILNEL